MIIIVKPDASEKSVKEFIDSWKQKGFDVHVSRGENTTILGLLGDTSKLDTEVVGANDIVEHVERVSAPYKMAGRSFHPENTVVTIGGGQSGVTPTTIGNGVFTVMAGPCSIESLEQLTTISKLVKKSGARMIRGGAFKPRTSPYSFQGLGREGIKYLSEIKRQLGLPVITELMDIRELPAFEDVDMIQIGARNMQNFDLLKEVGKTKKPILLKRGLCATLKELLMSAEYIMANGNENVILCERGIRSYDNYTRNCLDISAVPYLKKVSHLPVVVDPSHASGVRWMVPILAKAAIAVGADGLEIEVHNEPEKAVSDGDQSLYPEQFDEMMKSLQKYAAIDSRTL